MENRKVPRDICSRDPYAAYFLIHSCMDVRVAEYIYQHSFDKRSFFLCPRYNALGIPESAQKHAI